jgi:hypothetical protein
MAVEQFEQPLAILLEAPTHFNHESRGLLEALAANSEALATRSSG